VCYAHDDRDVVYPEISWLHGQGIKIWYDEGISAGRVWRAEIADAMDRAARVVYYVSKASLESSHCNREINYALDKDCEVLPVYLEAVELTPDLQIGLSRVQALFRTTDANYQQHLLSALDRVATKRVPVPSKPSVHRRRNVGIGLGVALVIVLIWWYAQPSPAPVPTSAGTSVDDARPYLLVAPFGVSGGDQARWEPFADQITREIIRKLRKISGLRVVPPPSAFTFKGNKLRSHIRSQLPDVSYVLDGHISVASPSEIRITPALESLHDEVLIWDDDYESRIDDRNFFAVQAEIAAAVSNSLKIAILDDEKRALNELPTENLEAYELYVEGRRHHELYTHDGQLRAIELFDQAIAVDSDFAAAYVAKASAYRVLMSNFVKPIDMLANVSASVFDAISVDPNSAQARSTLGVAYVLAWRWRDAWKMLNDARSRDPDLALTELGFALYYSGLGDLEGVQRSLDQAIRLDPLNIVLAEWGTMAYTMVGELDRAIDLGDKHMRLHPRVGIVYSTASIASSLSGQHDRAIALAEEGALIDSRTPLTLLMLAQAYGRAGQTDKVRPVLAEAAETAGYMCPYETATAYLLLDDVDRAFALMEDAVSFRANCLIFTRYDPRLEPMRNDPRFATLLAEVGLDDESVRTYPR
jgi:TolB-like protein/Tfp pilus assembly protein PilF|tara:strand:+ start:5146 stop:7077 length:1932 start_codon:yes stop_codon:yes gene_type:complete